MVYGSITLLKTLELYNIFMESSARDGVEGYGHDYFTAHTILKSIPPIGADDLGRFVERIGNETFNNADVAAGSFLSAVINRCPDPKFELTLKCPPLSYLGAQFGSEQPHELTINGNAKYQFAHEMKNGILILKGNAHNAGTLMTNGQLIIQGNIQTSPFPGKSGGIATIGKGKYKGTY